MAFDSQNYQARAQLKRHGKEGQKVHILTYLVWNLFTLHVLLIDGEPGSVPPEILARGPKAQTAYKEALKKGKVKNYRVPVVLVGQARSGKTSLLRSLNGKICILAQLWPA